VFSDTLALDLGTVEPSLAGPKRPQDACASRERGRLRTPTAAMLGLGPAAADGRLTQRTPVAGTDYELTHGDVVIAAITSCTNTSNPR